MNNGLLPNALNLRPVPYTTAKEAFDRFSVKLFREVFQYLLDNFPFKHLPELATLGKLYCIDGSIFPVINSMQWAEYTSKYKALKLHLCFESNVTEGFSDFSNHYVVWLSLANRINISFSQTDSDLYWLPTYLAGKFTTN